MTLWSTWCSVLAPLRAACNRERNFLWLLTALAGICARPDLLGVTSIVRALGLTERCYLRLLEFFHSPGIDLQRLTRGWTQIVLERFPAHRLGGLRVFLADGLKVPKCGRKMPAVKRLHQVSDSNTKPEYIRGHSLQVVSLLVRGGSSFLAVPLIARIHEGVKFTNRDQRTLPEKLTTLIDSLALIEPFVLIADAYYACAAVAGWALERGAVLISRVRRNAVGYEPAVPPAGPRKRGRPRRYGPKVRLRELFDSPTELWQEADSPVYGERAVTIRFLSRDLLWRPLRRLVRFVLVIHPTRGRCIFLSTNLSLPALEIIAGYGLRFKIELSFKQALRVIGAYQYHFWMRGMKSLSRSGGTQYLHRKPERYRNAVRRKIAAYHRHIQVGLIAQGLLQYLAIKHPREVWASFGSWLRTIRDGLCPSELVCAAALRNALPEYLADSVNSSQLQKFLRSRIDPALSQPLRLAG